MFESLKKVVRGNTKVVETQADIDAILGGYPVIENVSGLPVGTVISKMGAIAVVVPEIRGVKRNASIVIECEIDGQQRPIYLSSFLRKANIEDPFKGMIETDPLFKDRSNFTNKEWVDALAKACPFHVEASEPFEREIANNDGTGMTTIKGKQLTLKKGAK